jgi:polyhydroxyalkanoate synthesis regulator phasin
MTAAVAGVALASIAGAGIAVAATGDGPGSRLADVLAGLVQKGTINQEQADAVEQALGDARAEGMAEREQHRAEQQAEVDALLKDTLGLTREQVRERLAAGETLREIAGDNADEFVAGLQKLQKEHLDEAVADGRMTQEQADQFRARSDERVQSWLDGEDVGLGREFGLGPLGRGMGDGMRGDGSGMGRGPGGHHGGGFGMGGQGLDDGADDATTGSTSMTTFVTA